MNQYEPASGPASTGSSAARVGLIVLGVVVGVLIAGFVVFKVSRPSQPFAGEWSRRTVDRISLDAPFDFKYGPQVALPQHVQAAVANATMMVNTNTNNAAQVSIASIIYNKDVNVDLSGAVQGAMNNAANAGKTGRDRTQADYKVSDFKLDGFEARRANFKGKFQGKDLFVDGVFARDGQSLWMVIVVYHNTAEQQNAKRLLDSVHLSK
jgi:hypothetical protein